MCNRATPGDYEVCAVDAKNGTVREVTSLDGVERFRLSPDEKKLLLHWSSSYTPVQLAVAPAGGGAAVKLTDTRSAEFKAQIAAELEAQVWPLLATRKIAPVMDMIYPLRDAWRAHEHMEEGEHIGKIVLDVA